MIINVMTISFLKRVFSTSTIQSMIKLYQNLKCILFYFKTDS